MKMKPWIVAFSLLPPLAPRASGGEEMPQILQDLAIDQRLDAQVSPDLAFVDAAGNAVKLGDYFGKRPLILSLVYYECPSLCTLVLNGLLRSLRAMPLDLGEDFDVLTVSFDHEETPRLAESKKRSYVGKYGRGGGAAGWHFLTGREEAVAALARAVGFRYRYDPATDEYAHSSAVVVLTPTGKVARYFFGVEYSSGDLRLSLVEAAENRIGSVVDSLLLYCFRYDPARGRYSLVILNAVRLGGAVTLLGLVAAVGLMLARDRRRRLGDARAKLVDSRGD